jgi:hypothetical protein
VNEHRAINPACTEMERYLFDLNGYLILRNALSPEEVAACNATYDELEAAPVQGRGWHGNVPVYNSGRQEGLIFQQLYEAGPVWEGLLDHPSWYAKAIHFIGTDDPENFDGHHGPAFIDECFGTIRGPGGAQRLHSGGHVGTIRTQFRYHAGKFHCGQINVLMAFTDIGPGDGATMVIPGSHKSNIRHPQTVATTRSRSMGWRAPSSATSRRATRYSSSMPSPMARRGGPIRASAASPSTATDRAGATSACPTGPARSCWSG